MRFCIIDNLSDCTPELRIITTNIVASGFRHLQRLLNVSKRLGSLKQGITIIISALTSEGKEKFTNSGFCRSIYVSHFFI